MRVYMKVHIGGCKKVHIKVCMKIMFAFYPMKTWKFASKFAVNFTLNFATEVAKNCIQSLCLWVM